MLGLSTLLVCGPFAPVIEDQTTSGVFRRCAYSLMVNGSEVELLISPDSLYAAKFGPKYGVWSPKKINKLGRARKLSFPISDVRALFES